MRKALLSLAVVAALAAGTTLAYRILKPEWVRFRQAEDL